MSWDVTLYDDRGHCEFDQNYTHNVNGMANDVLTTEELTRANRAWWLKRDRQDIVQRIDDGDYTGGSWWVILDGMSGEESMPYLQRLIDGLEADPKKYRAMNPENGWGDYDTFLAVLKAMRDAVPKDWPSEWSASG